MIRCRSLRHIRKRYARSTKEKKKKKETSAQPSEIDIFANSRTKVPFESSFVAQVQVTVDDTFESHSRRSFRTTPRINSHAFGYEFRFAKQFPSGRGLEMKKRKKD